MSSSTSIEWTEATWNPVRGCALVSPGCTNCYAMRQAHRHARTGRAYEGLTKMSKAGPVWTGQASTVPQLLDWPLHKRKPLRIFVNSMSDLFHEDVDVVFIASVLGIASACPQHTFQVLTKRPARMLEVLQSDAFLEAYDSSQAMYTHTETPWPAPNVWIGVSVEDQVRADERIPLLLQTPAAVHWISLEPLLGPVDLTRISLGKAPVRTAWPGDAEQQIKAIEFTINALKGARTLQWPGLDWVVVGGESGPGARAFRPEWARSIVKQCRRARVPVFVKQMGSYVVDRNDAGFDGCEPGSWPLRPDGCDPEVEHEIHGFREQYQGADCRIRLVHRKGGDPREWPEDLRVREYPHA